MNASIDPFGGTTPAVVDLHLHTTASDGLLTPAQLIKKVGETSLRVVAVTDHDSTNGIDEAIEAADKYLRLDVVAGIELSTHTENSAVHLLGLYIDNHDLELEETLRAFRIARVDATRRSVEKLNELGVEISWQRVQELAEGTIGRPHIARAMVEAGYIETPKQAFDEYLGDDGLARVEREQLSTLRAIDLVHSVGGAAVVAHPRTVDALDEDLPVLVEAGLDGIEVFAERYSDEARQRFADLARRYDLVPCGGSDYHAFGTDDELEPGAADVPGPPMSVPGELMRRAAARVVRREGANSRIVDR